MTEVTDLKDNRFESTDLEQASSTEPASSELNSIALASPDPLPDQPSVNPGSALASLWILTSQDHSPPVSVPSTVPKSTICPKCGMHFSTSLYSPIHQACLNCGWSDLLDA